MNPELKKGVRLEDLIKAVSPKTAKNEPERFTMLKGAAAESVQNRTFKDILRQAAEAESPARKVVERRVENFGKG